MYQQADTTNRLGRRRWTSGLQGYLTSEALARRMPVQSARAPAGWTGLGGNSGTEIYSNPAEWWNLTEQFRDLNQQIIELENLIRTDPVVARAIASGVQAARVKYENAAAQYIDLYRAVFGDVPTGLTALPVIPAWAVVSVAAIVGLVISIREICATLRVQAQMAVAKAAEANKAALIKAGDERMNLAAARRKAGDIAGAEALEKEGYALYAQAGTPGEPPPDGTGSDLSAFLEKNWPWVLAGGAAALYAVKVL